MNDEIDLSQAFQRVHAEASAARTFFHTWKALNLASGNIGLRATMSYYNHHEFFITSLEGNFRLTFQSLEKIFDENRKAAGLQFLAKMLRDRGHHADLTQEIGKLRSDQDGTIEKILSLKNESIPRNGLASTCDVLGRADITPDEIETLIDKLCGILKSIGGRMDFPYGVSGGRWNELAVQHFLETLRDGLFPRTKALEWDQVRQLFKEYGCVIFGNPEIRWYQESWEALGNAGLTNTTKFQEFELAQAVLRLRAICLLAMYLGMYQAAGEYSDLGGYFDEHSGVSSYLESLDVQMESIWDLARMSGMLETGASNYWEDEDTDEEWLCEIAVDLVREENAAIFAALAEHYGGNAKLFASLWNSRVPLNDIEPFDTVVNSVQSLETKLKVWDYVEGQMKGWWV